MQEIIFFIQNNIQIFTILHVLAVVIGMGGAIITDMFFIYFGYNKLISREENKVLKIASHLVVVGLIFIIFTGAMLFISNIDKYLNSAKFLTKITVVTMLSINGLILHLLVFKNLAKKHFLDAKKYKKYRLLAFICGAVSVVSWFSAISLGILDSIAISFASAISIYFLLLVLGIFSSFVLYRLFEVKQ
jgi:hypothetical protein